MAIKTKVKEVCDRCGKIDGVATQQGIKRGHQCYNKPVPGPPSPPVLLPWSSAYLVHPDGTATMYQSPDQ